MKHAPLLSMLALLMCSMSIWTCMQAGMETGDFALWPEPAALCGDGVVEQLTEVCDDGDAISNGEGTCVADCTAVQHCGNGVIEGTEVCENPSQALGACAADCLDYSCGNGKRDPWEACDDGDRLNNGEGSCAADCSAFETCGDGKVVGFEKCDPEPGCDPSCQYVASRVYFRETFDSYDTDAKLTAGGWSVVETVTNPDELEEVGGQWTVSSPGLRPAPSGGDGRANKSRFMISDSDRASGGASWFGGTCHDLISPAFSTRGGSVVWAHASATLVFNDDGSEAFYVDVSNDDGASWHTAFQRFGHAFGMFGIASTLVPAGYDKFSNTDASFGRIHADVTNACADSENARVRFRFCYPSDDWYVTIDDVVVSDESEGFLGGAQEVLRESFDSSEAFPPVGWSIHGLAEFDVTRPREFTWNNRDYNRRYLEDPTGNMLTGTIFPLARIGRPFELPVAFAIIDNSLQGYMARASGSDDLVPVATTVFDEYLVTPIMDLRDYREVFLTFEFELHKKSGSAEILISYDGGNSFDPNPLFVSPSIPNFQAPWYDRPVLTVPRAVGHERVAFAFHFRGIASGVWAIDTVHVSGTR